MNKLVGDLFYTGMDTVKIENEGAAPLKEDFQKIDKIKTKKDLIKELAYLHSFGANSLFAFYASTDAKNSSMNIAEVSQSGLGLPDRDYYLNDDARSKEIRDKYQAHIKNLFILAGENAQTAQRFANSIMGIETRLAKASMSRVEMRDPKKTYNKMSVTEFSKLAPNFAWNYYFSETNAPGFNEINVSQPEFFKEVSKMIDDVSIKDWQAYLKWDIIREYSNFLGSKFVDENFDFGGKFLNGLKVQQPRWKVVLRTVNGLLGQALGQLYVKEAFPPEAKERAVKIVHNLLNAMGERIKALDWMGEATKLEAQKKLDAFTVKIGYPDKWKDYSGLQTKRDSYLKNEIRISKFLHKQNLNKIGNPVDKTEWMMNPQTVNAYYSGSKNEIVFPAAILQPPFFNVNADDAINYGAMGAVIGHEVTHGFDDEGRQYDAEGNLRDWWTKEDAEKFDARAEKIVEQFNSYTPVDTFHINGSLTQGENIADLGGLNVALTAFKKTDQYKNNTIVEGFSPTQRFFLAWAQVWKNNIRDAALMLRLKTDPHSPGKYRVNGPMSNMPEFWAAFNVNPGDKMERPTAKLVKIW